MTHKMIVSYSEEVVNSQAHQWIESHNDHEIIAVNFIKEDTPLLANAAMVVGAKKVYCIEHHLNADELKLYMANKLIHIAEKEKASIIVTDARIEQALKHLLKAEQSICIMSPDETN